MAIEFLLHGSHDETQRSMSAYADGELRGYKRWRVSRHLARCDVCRSFYRSLLATLRSLRELRGGEPEPKPEIVDSVVERIRDDEAPRST